MNTPFPVDLILPFYGPVDPAGLRAWGWHVDTQDVEPRAFASPVATDPPPFAAVGGWDDSIRLGPGEILLPAAQPNKLRSCGSCGQAPPTSRFSVFAHRLGKPRSFVGAGDPTLPVIHLHIAAGAGCSSSEILHAIWTPVSWGDGGFLLEVTAPLCNQWEIRAWGDDANQTQPFGLSLHVFADRVAGLHSLLGTNVVKAPPSFA